MLRHGRWTYLAGSDAYVAPPERSSGRIKCWTLRLGVIGLDEDTVHVREMSSAASDSGKRRRRTKGDPSPMVSRIYTEKYFRHRTRPMGGRRTIL